MATLPPPPVDNSAPGDPGNPNNLASQTASTGVTPMDGQPSTQSITMSVGGRAIQINLNGQLRLSDSISQPRLSAQQKRALSGPGDIPQSQSVQDKILEIQNWYNDTTKRAQIIQQMYAAGLVTSKKAPPAQEVAQAWAHVVQEAALESQAGATVSPEDLLAKAAQGGWNALNPRITPQDSGLVGTGNLNNAADSSVTSSQTIYKSYLDPATVMGTQADAWYRLMGRNPTNAEYHSFLNSVFHYQDASNTGKFEEQMTSPANRVMISPTTGQPMGPDGSSGEPTDPTKQTTTVTQRGVGMRGLQFLAGQAALSNPEEGAYQAATTYFNAFIKALSGPAAGMQASGPTTTVP